MRGTVEGADMSAAAALLIGRGIHPVDIVPAQAGQSTVAREPWRPFAERVTSVDLLLFTRQLGTLLKSGVPILQALAGLQQSAVNPAFIKVLERVRESQCTFRRCVSECAHALPDR